MNIILVAPTIAEISEGRAVTTGRAEAVAKLTGVWWTILLNLTAILSGSNTICAGPSAPRQNRAGETFADIQIFTTDIIENPRSFLAQLIKPPVDFMQAVFYLLNLIRPDAAKYS